MFNERLSAEVTKLREELRQEQKVRYVWRLNCEQLA